MTVSSEPDGSILGLAHQILSSGSAAMFCYDAAFEIGYHCCDVWDVINEQISFLMLQLKY